MEGTIGKEKEKGFVLEKDSILKLKIRPVSMIKRNPSLFYVNPFTEEAYEMIGGHKFIGLSSVFGFLNVASYQYMIRTQKIQQYTRRFYSLAHFSAGFIIAGFFAYHLLADKQRIHNAYIAHRLFKRYPQSKSLKNTHLYAQRLSNHEEEFYKWK
jgi:hypothetical protein